MLMRSYGRRVRYEAQVLAQEVGKIIAHMFGEQDSGTKSRPTKKGARRQSPDTLPQGKISAPELLRVMKVKEP
jgi:hypothetical protein